MKRIVYILILIFTIFSTPAAVLASEVDMSSDNETDLQIRTETITQRQYAKTAVTDGYGIEILTEEGYAQAQEIAKKQEQDYLTAQTALFSSSDTGEYNIDVQMIAEQLGMFDSNYTISSVKVVENKNGFGTILIIFVLMSAVVGGILIAVAWQKWKGRRAL